MKINKEQIGILHKALSSQSDYVFNISKNNIIISCPTYYCLIRLEGINNREVTINNQYFNVIKKSIKQDFDIEIKPTDIVFKKDNNTIKILLEKEYNPLPHFLFEFNGVLIDHLHYIFTICDRNLSLELLFNEDCVVGYQFTKLQHFQHTIYTDTKSISGTHIHISSEVIKVIKSLLNNFSMILIDVKNSALYLYSNSKDWYYRVVISPVSRVGPIKFTGDEFIVQSSDFINAIKESKYIIKDEIQNYLNLYKKDNTLNINSSYGNSINTNYTINIEGKSVKFHIVWSKNMASWCIDFLDSSDINIELKTNYKVIQITQKLTDQIIVVTTPLRVL